MSDILDKVFSEEKGDKGAPAQVSAAPEPQEPAATPAPTAAPAAEPTEPTDPSATPAPAQTTAPESKHVPLEALEAERNKRKDWKERATRAEVERDMLREQLARGNGQPQEPVQIDPVQAEVAAISTLRFNESERMVRAQHGDTLADEALEALAPIMKADAALSAKIMQSPHPWAELVKEHQRRKVLAEVGEDPAAYRERIRNELKAEMMATTPAPTAAPAPAAPARLPNSLATANSAASRSAPAWTGPTPISDIFPN